MVLALIGTQCIYIYFLCILLSEAQSSGTTETPQFFLTAVYWDLCEYFSFFLSFTFFFLHCVNQVMSEDLIPEKMREDYQDGESLSSVCVQSFSDRWWTTILQSSELETGDPQKTTPSSDGKCIPR